MDQFVGEIRIVPFNFAPTNWALCNGQIMSIAQNTALFSLLGTQFGGNGTSNFALPNLQGDAPMCYGNGVGLTQRVMGEQVGESTVTLTLNQIPSHNHAITASTAAATLTTPAGNILAEPVTGPRKPNELYGTTGSSVSMLANIVQPDGGNLPHNNLQPYLTLNFIIALTGIFPPRQ